MAMTPNTARTQIARLFFTSPAISLMEATKGHFFYAKGDRDSWFHQDGPR